MSTSTSPSQKAWQQKYYESHKTEIYAKQKEYHADYQKVHAEEINARNKKRRYEMLPVRYVVRKDGEAHHCKTMDEVAEITGANHVTISAGIRRNKGTYIANGYEIVDLNSNVINESQLWPNNFSWKVYGEGIIIQDPDKFMEELSDREKAVLLMRYKDHKNLEDIGKQYHVTRERVRQIETRAIRKLQKKERII